MPDHSSQNSKIAKNTLFLTVRLFFVLAINLYMTRKVLEVLGAQDYGIYNVVCGFVTMFSFLNTSMTNGIQRFYNYKIGSNEKSGITDVYNTALRVQLILSLVIITLTETIGLWYLYNKMSIPAERFDIAFWIFQSSIFSLFFVVISVPYSAIIMAKECMDYYALVGIIDVILRLIFLLLIPLFSADALLVYGVLMSLVSIICFFLYYSYSRRHFPEINFKWGFDKKLFSSVVSFSGWNLFGSFSCVMKDQGINLVLNYFFGPIVNAARAVAHQVNGAIISLVANLSISVRPQVVQSYAAKDIRRTLSLTYSISRISCAVFFTFALPLGLEIDFILKIWLGSNVPGHTSSFLIIILFISFINCLNTPISGVVHASGQMKLYQISTSFVSLLCIPLAIFVLHVGGTAEMAMVMVFITALVSHFVSLLVLRYIVTFFILDYLKKVLLPLLIFFTLSSVMPVLSHMFINNEWMRFMVVGITAVLGTVIISYLTLLTSSEKELIKVYINKIKKR